MAVFTPGTASMRSTVSLKVWRMRSLLLVLAGDRLSEKVRTWSGSNPGWTRPRLQMVRSIRPAPARSTSAAATSDTTSRLRRRRCPVEEPRLPSFKVSCRSVTETWSAGASPNTTPVTSESPRVKASTQPSTPMFSMRGRPPGTAASTARVPSQAMASPAMPPARDSTTLSVSSWRTTRARAAPSARRMAISFWRRVKRARSRFATFVQAMRSTKPTAPSRTRRVGRTSPTITPASGVISTPCLEFDFG